MAGQSIEIESFFQVESQMVSEIVNNFSEWKSRKKVYEDAVKENIRYVYATSTRETENGDAHNHSTHLPKMANLFDNLTANYLQGLMPHEDWFNVEGEDTAALKLRSRQRIVSFLKTKHRLKKISSVVKELINDWTLGGNCFAEVYYTQETQQHPLTGAVTPGYQGPVVKRIDPNDIVFNPIAKDFESSPKIIRSLKSLGELAREIEENPDDTYKIDVLTLVLQRRGLMSNFTVDDINKSLQMKMDGFGSFGDYLKGQYVEFLDFYGDIYDLEGQQLYKNHVITVVDRTHIARNEPLKTWSGRPHIFHGGWRQRPNNLWAQGPLDNLVGMQFRMNHLENARADAFDDMLFGDLIYQGDVETRTAEDGSTTYFAPENGGVQRLAPDTTVLNADFQINGLETKMEMYVGAPRDAMGFRTPGEKTKFEVSSLQNASSRIFQHKMEEFEENVLEKILNAEIEVSVVHMSGRDTARMDDPESGVAAMISISKDDLSFNGRIVPKGASHFARQAQLASDLLQFQQAALQDEEVKNHFPSKKLAQAWEAVLGAGKFELFQANGRIPERLEAQRLTQAAEQTAAEENEVGLSDLEGGEVTAP